MFVTISCPKQKNLKCIFSNVSSKTPRFKDHTSCYNVWTCSGFEDIEFYPKKFRVKKLIILRISRGFFPSYTWDSKRLWKPALDMFTSQLVMVVERTVLVISTCGSLACLHTLSFDCFRHLHNTGFAYFHCCIFQPFTFWRVSASFSPIKKKLTQIGKKK